MQHRYTLFFLFLFLFLSVKPIIAQQPPASKADSAKFYKNIERFSKQRKITRLMYGLIFKPVPTTATKPVKKKNVKQRYYTRFEGKIIRNIFILTADPFGYNTSDTTVKPTKKVEKIGNYLHLKSLPLIIKNQLLIKKHDVFDSVRVRESERLIRSQNYVREVFFTPALVKKTDSVDIYIRVYDLWSIIANGSISMTGLSADLKENNFLGLGHQFQNTYGANYVTGAYSYATNYYVSNISNTYINSTLHYDIAENKTENKSFGVERPFYSIFARWAGGIYLLQHVNRSDKIADTVDLRQNYKTNAQDYWIGKSWPIFRNYSEHDLVNNFILSARYVSVNYLEKPPPYLDPANTYSNENFYLLGFGISKLQYTQDNYIFKYGFVEDVPLGKTYSLVGGYQRKNNKDRWYVGARMYWSSYYNWGYLSSNIEYGTFITSSELEEDCFTGGINYFSPLLTLGKWKFRQFIKPQFTAGFHRVASDILSINNEYGIKGFNSLGLVGTKKMVLVLQSQSYAPWNVLGFRFGPYVVCSFAALGDNLNNFKRSRIYSQFGFGMLIKNDFLVINSFEVSIAFFPFIPGVGNNVIKVNPFKTTDFGFRNSYLGKPSPVAFQ